MVEGHENLVAALSPVSDSRILEVVIEVMTNSKEVSHLKILLSLTLQ